jgi:hypothetical protein
MSKWIAGFFIYFLSYSALASPPEDIIRSLYTSDIQEVEKLNSSMQLNLEVKEVELNDTPPKEIMARFLHTYYCGTLGCKTVIISLKQDKWIQITPYLVTQGELTISNNVVNGFHSLTFDNGKLWQYNGSKYQ